jgi:hypothetical protein
MKTPEKIREARSSRPYPRDPVLFFVFAGFCNRNSTLDGTGRGCDSNSNSNSNSDNGVTRIRAEPRFARMKTPEKIRETRSSHSYPGDPVLLLFLLGFATVTRR